MVAVLYLVFLIAWTVFAAALLPVGDDIDVILQGRTVADMVILMTGFGAMTVALKLVLRLLHKRSLATLIGPRSEAWRQTWAVGKMCLLLTGVFFLIPLPGSGDLVQAMSLSRWIVLLPLSLVLLVIQCSAEELVFRGYLQSQLAADGMPPLVWIGVPSLLFGMLHYAPDIYGETAVWVAVWATVFGVMMADITARAGTLAPAIVIHVINNFMAMSVTGFENDLGGLALYHLPYAPNDAEVMRALLPLELLSMLCVWLIARIALRR